jgi:hypothetical protein
VARHSPSFSIVTVRPEPPVMLPVHPRERATMQFEINHSQQTAAFNAVDEFSQQEKAMFATLESQLTSAMAKAAGSYNTMFHKVLVDVQDTENQINSLLQLMVSKMQEVRSTYQTHDDTGQQLNSAVLSRSGGSNFNYGIW